MFLDCKLAWTIFKFWHLLSHCQLDIRKSVHLYLWPCYLPRQENIINIIMLRRGKGDNLRNATHLTTVANAVKAPGVFYVSSSENRNNFNFDHQKVARFCIFHFLKQISFCHTWPCGKDPKVGPCGIIIWLDRPNTQPHQPNPNPNQVWPCSAPACYN